MKSTFIEKVLFPPKSVSLSKLEQKLNGKTVLITGGSFGIGEELAYFLGFKNTTLILVGRTTKKLKKIQHKIEQSGGNVQIFTADLRDEIQLNRFIEFLNQQENGIDIFVNNAGKSIKRSIFKSLDRFHDFKRTMAINYFAPVKLSLALLPMLQKNNGQIINISAINVLFLPMPDWSAYQASKTAFDQWFRSISPRLNSVDICTSTVYLPLVRTRMIAPTKMYNSAPAMQPKEVAKVIGKLMLNRKKRFKPWWCIFVEIGSFLFKRPVEFFVNKYYKN